MTEYTENYNLGKQTNKKDRFDMSIITENWDILDDCMKNFDERISTLESKIVILSQSEYDALATKSPDTIYMIKEAD